jgi:sugar phosphate isomerase/epimerase
MQDSPMNKNVIETNVEPLSLPPLTKSWIYALRHCPDQLQDEIETTKRLGIERVALKTDQPLTEASIDELSRTSHSLLTGGLAPHCLNIRLCGPFIPLDRPRTHVKNEIKQLKLAINAASKIGIKHINIGMPPSTLHANASRFQDDLATYALEVMHAIRYEAEFRAIQISIELPTNGFSNSLAEARDFIDECNSPWIGACLPLAAIPPSNAPVDWILTLGRRLFCCLINLSEADSTIENKFREGLRAVRSHNPTCSIILQAFDLAETQIFERHKQLHDIIESPRVA